MQGNGSSIPSTKRIIACCVGGDLDWPVGMIDLHIQDRSVRSESIDSRAPKLDSLETAAAAWDRQPKTTNFQKFCSSQRFQSVKTSSLKEPGNLRDEIRIHGFSGFGPGHYPALPERRDAFSVSRRPNLIRAVHRSDGPTVF